MGLENVPNVDAEPFVFIAHLMTPFSPEDVVVFTNCDEVRLYAYDKEIGTKNQPLQVQFQEFQWFLKISIGMLMREIKIKRIMVK